MENRAEDQGHDPMEKNSRNGSPDAAAVVDREKRIDDNARGNRDQDLTSRESCPSGEEGLASNAAPKTQKVLAMSSRPDHSVADMTVDECRYQIPRQTSTGRVFSIIFTTLRSLRGNFKQLLVFQGPPIRQTRRA